MTSQLYIPGHGSFFWPYRYKNKIGNAKKHRFPRFPRFFGCKLLFFNGILFVINFSFFSFFSLLILEKRYGTIENEIVFMMQSIENQSQNMETIETRLQAHSHRKTTLIQVAAIITNPNTFAL